MHYARVRRTQTGIATVILIITSTHQLPAPVQEVTETPTPPRTPSQTLTTPKPHPVRSKPKPAATATSTPPPPQNRFDGTWVGTINNIAWIGNVDFTLFVLNGGTAVTEKSDTFGTKTFQATCNGNTAKWETGASWTLTPNPDGNTALVTCNGAGFLGFGAVSAVGVFQRTSQTAIEPAPSSTTSDRPPVAKPVPGKAGLVYNPFDPTSRVLLDVRGRRAGTKVIEPKSGKVFVVP